MGEHIAAFLGFLTEASPTRLEVKKAALYQRVNSIQPRMARGLQRILFSRSHTKGYQTSSLILSLSDRYTVLEQVFACTAFSPFGILILSESAP